MIYTKQEKQKLERVISVFAKRLKESDAFDLVWSDKVGYVLLDISPNYDYVDMGHFLVHFLGNVIKFARKTLNHL